jgi:hypothetical protein
MDVESEAQIRRTAALVTVLSVVVVVGLTVVSVAVLLL